ncbi:MAG: hypothetical protein ACRD1E_08745, partial [Terriglobales bacterium]
MRQFTEHSTLGKCISRRFVPGLTLDDAIAAVNQCGMTASLDPLGENVTSAAAANAAASAACDILAARRHSQRGGRAVGTVGQV